MSFALFNSSLVFNYKGTNEVLVEAPIQYTFALIE